MYGYHFLSFLQNFETKIDQFDSDFEPPIIIGAITQLRHKSEDNFDSTTLLNYLMSSSSEATNVDITMLPDPPTDVDKLETTSHNLNEESIKEEYCGTQPPTSYNMSMESGVVMDPEPDVVRKISDRSNCLSQGSHSYVCTKGTITCSCSECQIHREWTHSSTGAVLT